MVKVGGRKNERKRKYGEFINFAEICIIGLGDGQWSEWTPLDVYRPIVLEIHVHLHN